MKWTAFSLFFSFPFLFSISQSIIQLGSKHWTPIIHPEWCHQVFLFRLSFYFWTSGSVFSDRPQALEKPESFTVELRYTRVLWLSTCILHYIFYVTYIERFVSMFIIISIRIHSTFFPYLKNSAVILWFICYRPASALLFSHGNSKFFY